MSNKNRPIIGITLGDPAGIGPEIVLGALCDIQIYDKCVPVVIGNADILRKCSQATGNIFSGSIKAINHTNEAQGNAGAIDVINVETAGEDVIKPGIISREAGLAADAYIRRACELAKNGEIAAISTAPINKESLRLADVPHIGHTEMLSHYLNAPNPLTLFITENMRIFFLSRHFVVKAGN